MKLSDTNRYFLTGTNGRFLHLATVVDGLKEFMCFADRSSGQIYIEEISGGHLEFISDDSRALALHNFLEETGVLDVSKPLLPDEWLKHGQRK